MSIAEPNTSSAPVRIAVVDDHPMIHAGLAHIIGRLNDYSVALFAFNGQDLIAQHEAAEPVDIAIVDMYMPVMDGVETIQWLRANWPSTRVLGLSFDRSPAIVHAALSAGACGFIPKDISPKDLRAALDGVRHRGCYHHDPLIREHLAGGAAAPPPDLSTALTATEKKVLDCVCMPDEPTWEMVADRLGKSVPTVDSHRAALYKKLKVKSKSGLVSYGRARGFGKRG